MSVDLNKLERSVCDLRALEKVARQDQAHDVHGFINIYTATLLDMIAEIKEHRELKERVLKLLMYYPKSTIEGAVVGPVCVTDELLQTWDRLRKLSYVLDKKTAPPTDQGDIRAD